MPSLTHCSTDYCVSWKGRFSSRSNLIYCNVSLQAPLARTEWWFKGWTLLYNSSTHLFRANCSVVNHYQPVHLLYLSTPFCSLGTEQLSQVPSPRLVKTHLTTDLLPKSFWEKGCKVILSGTQSHKGVGQKLILLESWGQVSDHSLSELQKRLWPSPSVMDMSCSYSSFCTSVNNWGKQAGQPI